MAFSEYVVFGAGGGVGKACVERLLECGQRVRAVVRSPEKYSDTFPAKEGLRVVRGDVTDPASLKDCFEPGVKGAIFAASGKGFWSANAVDCQGVKTVAEAAISNNVEKVVLVTSCYVTPKHRFNPIRVILNNIRWGLMDSKLEGEKLLRSSGVKSYTIVRPGGLHNGPAGQDELIVGQGDNLGGRVSRSDVAAVCVAALTMPGAAHNVTLELIGKHSDTVTPLSKQLANLFDGLKADS